MAIIGGNLERKEIGLSIGVSGTHDKTKINKNTGFLELVDIDVDGQGNPIYVEQGSWTSDVIDLGDIFQDFEKVFTNSTVNGASSFAVLTRVSSNNYEWSDWVAIAEDGTIQSDTKQYIQVRIDLFAGFVTDVFLVAKNDFNINEFLEKKTVKIGGYVVPKLTSNTSSTEGFAFSESNAGSSYLPFKAFDKSDTNHYSTSNASAFLLGSLGFSFTQKKAIIQYKIRSISNSAILNSMPKDWVLQGSNNTTNGLDGDWINVDSRKGQSWNTINTDKTFELKKRVTYKAFRLKWSANNGNTTNTAIGELDFKEPDTEIIQLKRDYTFDKQVDSTWSDTGSLHRKKITRSQWQRIDRVEVL